MGQYHRNRRIPRITSYNVCYTKLLRFLGLGIPPSACYIISAVIVIPPMTRIGINPWVAHFFLFFIAIISEYSPPISLVAAVASRISGASFMKT